MTVTKVIEEIQRLSPTDQAEVIRFTFKLAGSRPLTGSELDRLAKRLVESDDPAEVEKLRSAIVHGFYGEQAHA